MMKKVSIIDYGMSNLLSICRAIEHVGAEVQIVDSAESIRESEYLILPGVGAFPDGMLELNKRGLTEAIQTYANTGKPLLGICLGMQMLLSKGLEHKETKGLGIIPGEVLPLPKNMPAFKVPNINWHSIRELNQGVWQESILQKTELETCFYFVHSYYAKPQLDEHVLATSNFGDLSFAAVIKKNNVTGTQFHPEKSGEDGLCLLKCFIEE